MTPADPKVAAVVLQEAEDHLAAVLGRTEKPFVATCVVVTEFLFVSADPEPAKAVAV
jgi:hypothetical protein